MADKGRKVENISSEVPGVQPLRESCNIENTTDNFVPVMTVTKKEAAYTKGDLKLQKVSVTENVSEIGLTELNPLYSEVFGDVISGPQPLRKIERHGFSRETKNSNDDKDQINDPKKTRTRIPTLKFRQTVEKVKNGKTRATEEARRDTQKDVQAQRPRRASIPKLKKPETNPMTTKRDDYPRSRNLAPTSKTEEEFDKIFGEIFTQDILDSDVNLIADETIILDTSLDDEKVLNSFEEIMNSYNEQKNDGVAVSNKNGTPKTKLPLDKQISQESPKISREIVRRNSLKNNSSLDKESVKVKAIDFSKIRLSNKPVYGKVTSPKSSNETNENVSIKSQNSLNVEGGKVNNSSDENVTVTVVGIADEHTKNKVLIDTSKDLNEFLNKAVDDKKSLVFENGVKVSDKIDEINDENEISSNIYEDSTKTEEDKSVRKNSVEDDHNILRGKVSRLISRMDSYHDTKETVDKQSIIEIPKKTSILSKIAMFERKESLQSVKSKDSREVKKVLVIKTADNTCKESICRKPKIIEEVLKSPKRLNSRDDSKQTLETKELKESTDTTTKINPVAKVGPKVILQNDSARYAKTVDIIKTAIETPVADLKLDEKDFVIDFKETPIEFDAVKEFKVENESNDKNENAKELQLNNKNNEIFKAEPVDVIMPEPVQIESDKGPTSPKEKTEETIIESCLKSLKSISDVNETGLKIKRSKSVIDIELGDTVKGKVQHIIETIKSERPVSNIQKEVINVKERPRKKSVLEKIALFERKVVPDAVEEAPKLPSPRENARNKDGRLTNNHVDTNEDVEDRISELTGARLKYGSILDMPTVELNNGARMPVLAVGTALLNRRLVHHIVGAAIDLGYRAVDSAYIYGNEQSIGDAITSKINDGTVKREDLYITSKLWSTFHHPGLVEQACRSSLNNMGLEYFDLYMIHNPMSFKEGGDLFPTIANVLQYSECDYLDAWFAMESLISKGLVRSIGLSNFNSQQIARIIDKGTIKPVINQVECHPYLSQERLSEYCDAHNILLSCYGALGSKGTPAALKSPGVTAVIDDPLIKVMASALNISPARLLIRYQLERSHAVVVKASTAGHLWDNLQALHCTLSSSEVEALNALNKNKRNFSFKEMGGTHKNYPFKIPF